MNIYHIILLLISFVLLIIILISKKQQREILLRINEMIDSAKGNEKVSQKFDESILSKTESKFADLLDSIVISENRTAAEKEKIKELISDISHQTKTPIANIKLYTELLPALKKKA